MSRFLGIGTFLARKFFLVTMYICVKSNSILDRIQKRYMELQINANVSKHITFSQHGGLKGNCR